MFSWKSSGDIWYDWNIDFTSDSVGSFAKYATVERWFSVGSVHGGSEDEKNGNDCENEADRHHFDDFGLLFKKHIKYNIIYN